MNVTTNESFWAESIRQEICEPDAAAKLINGVDLILPDLEAHLGFDRDSVGKGAATARPGARKQVAKLDSQIRKLSATLNDLSNHARSRINSADVSMRVESLISGTGIRELPPPDHMTLDSFSRSVSDMQSIVSSSLAELSASPGNPSNQLRDLLIRFIAYEFSKHAPTVILSNSTSALFYRVVDQYLSDNNVEEGNLPRTIKRLFPDGHLPI